MPEKGGDMARTKARLEPDGTVVRHRSGGEWERLVPRTDWSKVDATDDTEIAHQKAQDEAENAREAAAWARRVRRKAGLSQADFARRIGVTLETVRGWEQGKRSPDGAARSLLRLIEQIPETAIAVLAR